MADVLVVIPCSRTKIWDKEPWRGPTPASTAYIGKLFKANRPYAERFGTTWRILSAKYGLIAPDFVIPENYDVEFKDTAKGPVGLDTLRHQVVEQRLDRFPVVVALGGKIYTDFVRDAFAHDGTADKVRIPFPGLPIGKAMHAVKTAVKDGNPGIG